MADRKPASTQSASTQSASTKSSSTKSASTTSAGRGGAVLTAEEKAAMQDLARERQAARSGKTDGLADVLAKIAEMPDADAALARRIHDIVMATAPELAPRTWYGMPAYARDGKLVCFFQPASKFKVRYSTLGFEQAARLDEGTMWPTSYAIAELTPETEARIADLVRKAVG